MSCLDWLGVVVVTFLVLMCIDGLATTICNRPRN